YTINRHTSLNSYAADLSLIDQPLWNTVRGPGGFMEQTWGDRQQPRLAEHFEPILLPLALLFFVWDDVRILLIAQSVALALGALPVFWIAQHQLTIVNCQLSIVNYAALAFALVYLLYPHLQAANIADFHADPFVVTPLLFAFWYAGQHRWRWMWLWAIIAMSTKETLPTLTAMLGLYLVMQQLEGWKVGRLEGWFKSPVSNWAHVRIPLINGIQLIVVSMIWFLVATFLIVAPLARLHFGTEGPIYFENRYDSSQLGTLTVLQDPARWRYIFGLLMAVGFLPLLAPELLILGLPVLAANLLSNFPGQYSGEQHYSAPLVAAFIIAAIYGTRRLINNVSLREVNGQPLKTSVLIAAGLWLLTWSLSYHALKGWTPLSLRTESYVTSPATRLLPNLIDQIPPNAVVSASAGIHPHLAHRQTIYVFPTVTGQALNGDPLEADYLLVDVAAVPGVHPNDTRARLLDLLASDWQLLEARHGLILARKSSLVAPAGGLPASFFDFARADTPPPIPLSLAFGDGELHLAGYDLHDDPDDGVSVKFYWQATGPLPDDLRLWPLIFDDSGQLLSDPTQVPMVAALWYPPDRWQPGEIIVTETLPQLLPDTFHLGLAAGPPASFADPAQRWPIRPETGGKHPFASYPSGRWVQLASFRRQGPVLERHPPQPTLRSFQPVEARFGLDVTLDGYWMP
ncbi:MAG: DUF2079 domain-containing protein, partial [Anaerolineae bacterium]|nr:DUF2079 domain-containing protein [Anaerolineae bacterium]